MTCVARVSSTRDSARARGDPHGVRGLGGELGLAVAVDVLVQRAAARDVERLRAAADAEQRHPHGVGGAGERELEAVERGSVGPSCSCARAP